MTARPLSPLTVLQILVAVALLALAVYRGAGSDARRSLRCIERGAALLCLA